MEGEDQSQAKRPSLEEFLEGNKLTVGIFLLGVILLGLGVLGFKIFNFSAGQPKVEILGETDPTAGGSLSPSNYPLNSSITVEAAGEVQKPGVYELPQGSRINDLLVLAGGLSAEADRDWVEKNINMAARLQDGVKIYVPSRSEKSEVRSGPSFVETSAGKSGVVADKININTASEAELDTLWGIGPATAKKIIEGRPYQRTEELLEKKIVKSNVWEEIKDKITVY